MKTVPHYPRARASQLRLLGTALALLSASLAASAATYYVNSSTGSDSNSGLSMSLPWKSLAKVNATTFAAGDSVLFSTGGVWNGQLNPQGTGTSAAHIVLSSYGTGTQPIINGGGNTVGAIYLHNQEYWDVSNFEVTNTGASDGTYVGIKVHNDSGGVKNGVDIENCTIHNVNGDKSGYYGHCGGISVAAVEPSAYWNGVTIKNNLVYTVDRCGIFVGLSTQPAGTNGTNWATYAKTRNIQITGNSVTDSGGDGILAFVTDTANIQGNFVTMGGSRSGVGEGETGYSNRAAANIWTAIANNTTIQGNEVFFNEANSDGEAFDIDLGSSSTIVEYNYSHNNSSGFLLFCNGSVDISGAIVRFNVSYDDNRALFTYCTNTMANAPYLVNNTFYEPQWNTAKIIYLYPGGALNGSEFFDNNIFYDLGSQAYPSISGPTFNNNVFYGPGAYIPAHMPSDAHMLHTDPLLVAPGSAGSGLGSLNGFRLQTGSPALASGTLTSPTSILGPKDYYGNSVSTTAAPNRGAYDGAGISGVAPNYAFIATVTDSSAHDTGVWSPSRAVDGEENSTLNTFGFSSATGIATDHEEWVALKFASGVQTFSKVTLFPRNDAGNVGGGFPVNFTIQVWNGSTWLTRVTETAYPNPGGAPQSFTWGFSDVTDQIRIDATSLGSAGTDRILQFAEIEVNP